MPKRVKHSPPKEVTPSSSKKQELENHFNKLPNEVLEAIFKKLTFVDLARLSQSSKDFYFGIKNYHVRYFCQNVVEELMATKGEYKPRGLSTSIQGFTTHSPFFQKQMRITERVVKTYRSNTPQELTSTVLTIVSLLQSENFFALVFESSMGSVLKSLLNLAMMKSDDKLAKGIVFNDFYQILSTTESCRKALMEVASNYRVDHIRIFWISNQSITKALQIGHRIFSKEKPLTGIISKCEGGKVLTLYVRDGIPVFGSELKSINGVANHFCGSFDHNRRKAGITNNHSMQLNDSSPYVSYNQDSRLYHFGSHTFNAYSGKACISGLDVTPDEAFFRAPEPLFDIIPQEHLQTLVKLTKGHKTYFNLLFLLRDQLRGFIGGPLIEDGTLQVGETFLNCVLIGDHVYHKTLGPLTGRGKLVLQGKSYEGDLDGGAFDGNGILTETTEGTKKIYSGTFKESKLVRGTVNTFEAECLVESYEGELFDHNYWYQGTLTLWNANGTKTIYKGRFERNRYHGSGVLKTYHPNGVQSGRVNGHWKNGVFVG